MKQAALATALLLAACAAPEPPPVVVAPQEKAAPAAADALPEAAPAPAAVTDVDFPGLAAAGRWDELITAAAERLDAVPQDADALYWSGRAHLARGQQLLAGARFAQELGRSLLRRAAELLASTPAQGAHADAPEWALYARYLVGDDETLVADLERGAAAGSGYAARLRGELARDRGDHAAADWFERAATLMPERADVRIDLAAARAARGERAAALAALDEARQLGAAPEPFLSTLLVVLPAADDAAQRLALMEPVVQSLGPQDGVGAWYRAWALEQLGQVAEAEATLAAATQELRPEIVRTRARLLFRLRRPLQAAALAKPLALEGDGEALELLVSAADALAQAFAWDAALAVYDEALAIEPAHARARANQALTQARSGQPLTGYDALVASFPGRADLLNDAALSRLGRGEREAARTLLEQAVALGDERLPGVTDARENLALLRLGDRPPDAAGALALLEAVLSVDPARVRALTLREQARRALNASGARR